ncbi:MULTISPECIES: glycosyltransferase family A protein [unclassified Micromonospora]|uniref:glycosyltransferase family A protein n=1 Tax=unclassified Micromonospora TaxID=2617518 RepID=UPI0036335BB0
MPNHPQLSVVIPTYNRAPLLRKTLTSLTEQRDPPPFEVIVADDGSADDTEQVAEEFSDRLAIRYRYQEDQGFRPAKARNMGAAIARAPILVFLDSGSSITHHGLGLRTPWPDNSFDRVVITSRLSRLWPQWGEFIRAEASRIGVSAHYAPALDRETGTTVSS